jgi:aspartate carbamoyltransferase catalytic subunit
MKCYSDIVEAVEGTKLRSKNILRMGDLSGRAEIEALFEVARILEPLWRTGGLNLLPTKVLSTLFLQPSTRTRLGFQVSMNRLGGTVIAEPSPLITSRMASGESLTDTLRTLSSYVDIIAMRHPEPEEAISAVEKGAGVPVISAGFGGYEHPVAGYTDLYTMWRTFGDLDGLTVLILGPDFIKSRVSHSLTLGLAKFNTRIVLATHKQRRIVKDVIGQLKREEADFVEHLDPTKSEIAELIWESDVVYLSGFIPCVPDEEPERSEWIENNSRFYVSLALLEKAKKELGKTIRVMHALPRVPDVEMDHAIDDSEHALYWKQVDMAQPIRMAMILSILYGG